VLGDDEVSRVLVVTAHPDDVDFSAAGTVAGWTASGIVVTYAVVTDGDAGGTDRRIARAALAAVRRDEQRAAADAVGVTDVRFLGYRDGQVVPSLALRRDLTRLIRQLRPQRLLTHSPERNWERFKSSHPDHLACGEAALQAVYPDARNPFADPALLADERLEPWVVSEVWLMSSPRPNTTVDVTGVFGTKISAVRAHATQTGHLPDLPGVLTARGRRDAALGGLPDDRVAELFCAVSTR
jgi:LmbE family N-acetylglucosaminyl deacetylase